MLLFIVFISICLICYGVLLAFSNRLLRDIAVAILLTDAMALLICLIVLPIDRNNDRDFITRMHATQQTIDIERKLPSTEYERASITQIILQMNAQLAQDQSYAKSKWVSVFSDPEILNTQPLK